MLTLISDSNLISSSKGVMEEVVKFAMEGLAVFDDLAAVAALLERCCTIVSSFQASIILVKVAMGHIFFNSFFSEKKQRNNTCRPCSQRKNATSYASR